MFGRALPLQTFIANLFSSQEETYITFYWKLEYYIAAMQKGNEKFNYNLFIIKHYLNRVKETAMLHWAFI